MSHNEWKPTRKRVRVRGVIRNAPNRVSGNTPSRRVLPFFQEGGKIPARLHPGDARVSSPASCRDNQLPFSLSAHCQRSASKGHLLAIKSKSVGQPSKSRVSVYGRQRQEEFGGA
jgi:hypothetical protein